MSNKRTKGQLLLDDFLHKVDKSLSIAREKNVITLEELQVAWDAKDKLEKYLSTPQRDNHGLFMLDDEPTQQPTGKDAEK